MSDQEILDALTRIVRDLTENDDVILSAEMSAKDVPKWDSANFINFVVAVEMEYGVKFSLAEIESFVTFGDVVKCVLKRKT